MEGTCLNPALLDIVGKSVSGMLQHPSTSLLGTEAPSLQRNNGRLLRCNAILHHKKSKYPWKRQAKPCGSDGR